MNHTVIDNFLSDDIFNPLNDYLNDVYTPWFYKNGTTDLGERDISWFSNCFYEFNKPVNFRFDDFIPPILNKLNVRSLIRVQCNLTLKSESTKLSHTNWHTDYNYEDSKTAILYMNTNNGCTVLENGNNEYKVNSIRNRILIFPTNTLHRTQLHSDTEKRIVINFNYF